jgi:hypothetical protein
MNREELEKRIDGSFAKNRARIAVESPSGKLSSRWLFWAKRSDFYFGAKSAAGALKVSLHENGRGYLGFHKPYWLSKKENGVDIPSKTLTEWALPNPAATGAVHVASVVLPADFCMSEPLAESEKKKTWVLAIEKGCAAEVCIFLSNEDQHTLEPKLENIGSPLVMFTLDNQLKVSIVVRSRAFDPSILPTNEQFQRAKRVQLAKSEDLPFDRTLNAMFWKDPKDGGAIEVVDVGGIRIRPN